MPADAAYPRRRSDPGAGSRLKEVVRTYRSPPKSSPTLDDRVFAPIGSTKGACGDALMGVDGIGRCPPKLIG